MLARDSNWRFMKMSMRGKRMAIIILTLSHTRPFSVQRWSPVGFFVHPRERQVYLVAYICSSIRQILACTYEKERGSRQHQFLHSVKVEKVDLKGFWFPELHGLDWPGRRVTFARTNCQPQSWPTGLSVGD